MWDEFIDHFIDANFYFFVSLKKKSKISKNDVRELSSLPVESQVEYINNIVSGKLWNNESVKKYILYESYFLNSNTLFSHPHDLKNLEGSIQSFIPNWENVLSKSHNDQKHSPTLLIITSAATRAVDIIRHLSNIHSKCKIMKIFAKHFKISEQKDYLDNHIVRVAVGTPHRIHQLCELGSLQLFATKYILIDTFRDLKERTIFEYDDIFSELMTFIFKYCMDHLMEDQMKFILY